MTLRIMTNDELWEELENSYDLVDAAIRNRFCPEHNIEGARVLLRHVKTDLDYIDQILLVMEERRV